MIPLPLESCLIATQILPLPEILVIVGSFAVALLIGYFAVRRVRNQADDFLGGRKFGRTSQFFGADAKVS